MNGRSDAFEIRVAGAEEAALIEQMWAETSTWLKGHGYDQWQYPADPSKVNRDVRSGNAFLVFRAGECLGTISIDESADPEFWRAGDNPKDALYVHRVIVRDSARGTSLGSAMLDWASGKAEIAGKKWLRLDAWKTNADLGRYYESQGFEHVRTVDLPHRNSGALYQRRAGEVRGAGPALITVAP
ncbi:GNAT family N-acetyltransferase [Streptomyces sp. NPDC008079]|uniref:GNAT family N-acetyltransferase n=1 Tax=Streptomyces sp. NPDC008079 TaxID=3364806 RepID=UPI0036EE9C95